MSASCDIHEIIDEHNKSLTKWEEIVGASVRHFKQNLGQSREANRRVMDEVLAQQLQRISELDRDLMDKDLTEEDVLRAVKALASGQCPGPDGCPT
jgi:hypothetical protein